MTSITNQQTVTSNWEKSKTAPSLGPQRIYLAFHCRAEVKVIEISEGESYVVGRTFPSEIVLNDLSLSRQHARFKRTETAIHIQDLDSRNGLLVRGERISETVACAGDALALGNVIVVIYSVGMHQKSERRIVAYDNLIDRLEDEMIRSRQFHRSFVLAMLYSPSRSAGYISRFWSDVHGSLRVTDTLAPYGVYSMLLLLPETATEEAEAWANKLIRTPNSAADLIFGLATYPDDGTTPQELIASAHQACRLATQENPINVLSKQQREGTLNKDELVLRSDKMVEVRALIDRVAASTITVLIQGETGTGKELVARAVHRLSTYRDRVYKAVNCAAIPNTLIESTFFGHEKGAFSGAFKSLPGIFEQAADGTVFLDEIGELSNHAQAALLRFLETKQVVRIGGSREKTCSTRIIAATHCDLESMVEQGTFRRDLLYRLNTIVIQIPPLRERVSDIEPLIVFFLQQIAKEWSRPAFKIDQDALTALQRYPWPGNVRQLRNTIERAIVVCPGNTIHLSDLPDTIQSPDYEKSSQGLSEPEYLPKKGRNGSASLKEQVRAYEIHIIKNALEEAQGNRNVAAERLKVPVRTFYQKIKSYGLDDLREDQ